VATKKINATLDMTGHRIENLGDPAEVADAATRGYVDSGLAGFPAGTYAAIDDPATGPPYYFAADLGKGALFRNDGSSWRFMAGPVYDVSALNTTVSGDACLADFGSGAIPAGFLEVGQEWYARCTGLVTTVNDGAARAFNFWLGFRDATSGNFHMIGDGSSSAVGAVNIKTSTANSAVSFVFECVFRIAATGASGLVEVTTWVRAPWGSQSTDILASFATQSGGVTLDTTQGLRPVICYSHPSAVADTIASEAALLRRDR